MDQRIVAEPGGALPPEQGPKRLATARRAMVSTSHPAVTEAALAAMPLQQVLGPQMSTRAGGFGLLYWEAASGAATYLNANLDYPTGAPIPPRSATSTGTSARPTSSCVTR